MEGKLGLQRDMKETPVLVQLAHNGLGGGWLALLELAAGPDSRCPTSWNESEYPASLSAQ